MEIIIRGEVFAKREYPYNADPQGRWPAGVSKQAVILDLDKREIHTIKYKGAEAEIAFANLSLDSHVDVVCTVVANNSKLENRFLGYEPSAPVAVKADKTA